MVNIIGSSKVKIIKMSSSCRICADCGEYIYFGEDCVKEITRGYRQWHHISCWRNKIEKEN